MLDKMNKIRINTLILFIFTLTTTGLAMAYEEPRYKIIKTYQELRKNKVAVIGIKVNNDIKKFISKTGYIDTKYFLMIESNKT